jgi:hypothetical protein
MIPVARGVAALRYQSVDNRIERADKMRNGWRLSGPEIEQTVAVAARQLLNDHAAISASACNLGVGAGDIPAVLEAAGDWSRRLQSEADSAAALSGYHCSQRAPGDWRGLPTLQLPVGS